MKLHPIVILGLSANIVTLTAQAGTMGPIEAPPANRVYLGVFGGGGSSLRTHISQYGTAFYGPAAGGPLAVDVFGNTNRRSVGLVGGQLGYQFTDTMLNTFPLGLTPALELEGYYLGHSRFTGKDTTNFAIDTSRLPEHDFEVAYPMHSGVFLANAVLNFNPSAIARWHPYVGAGFGVAVVGVSEARAFQVSPPEPGVNHYNSNPDDTSTTIATQVKAGLQFELCENLGLFAEYRWLYLSNTDFAFGSTIATGHVPTSSWRVKLGPQYYNMGAIGVQYKI